METQVVVQESTSIWKNKNFIILFVSGAILALGSKVYELALPLILYDISQSSVAMSTMRGIEFLPNLLLALFIGVIVDRVNKKRWSLWAIFLQAMVLGLLYMMLELGFHPLFLFYISGFLLMTCSYAFFNARFSIVKQVLPHEMLTSANASFSFIYTLIGIMGPAISGFILLLSNLHDGLLFTAVAFIIALFSLMFLEHNEEKIVKTTNLLEDLTEGWKGLRSNRPLWLITIFVVFINSTTGMVDAMVIFFAKDSLHLDHLALGLVLSCAGVGGMVGSSLVAKLRKKFRMGHLLGVATLLTSLAFFFLYMANDPVLLGIGLFLEGLFGTITSICIWTYRQETTPTHMIGRISGITGSIFKLGMPFAIFAAGWLAQWFTPNLVFLVAMLLNIIIFMFYRKSSLWNI
ncbi:MFS transporter [Peribacillus acanthi]|uniref:MFS transporter n=1 Tax=Peribacillus acanthi TaxID=2171554 RepID=UPI000D3EAD88|nr:MFS transporter [Peribacillus acanthi]